MILIDNFLTIGAILVAIFLAQSVYKLWSLRSRTRKAVRQYGCQPVKRYPSLDPFLGIDLFRRLATYTKQGKRTKVWAELHAQYGETFEFKALTSNRISTISPKNFQAIRTTNFSHWGVEPIRKGGILDIIGPGVFTSDGEMWKHARAIIRPGFNRSEIADLENFELHVGRLLALIPRDGSTVDLQPLFKRLFLDTATEFIFGRSTDSLLPTESLEATEFLAAFDDALVGATLRSRAGLFKFLYYFDKTFEKAYRKVHAFVDKQVHEALIHYNELSEKGKAEREVETKRKYILLDQMIQETQDAIALRYQLMNVFLAARDTSAIAMANIMFQLARHPHCWEALRAEVQNIGEQPLTFELIRNLKVAKSIVNESLRINSPPTNLARIALKDTVLPVGGGPDQLSPLFVPKGTPVLMNMRALQTNPEIYGEDAEEFKPERWGDGRPLWEMKWQYEPFAGGPRICPASQQVVTQLAYLLVRLAQEFKGLENRDDVPEYVEEFNMLVQSKNGVKVCLSPA